MSRSIPASAAAVVVLLSTALSPAFAATLAKEYYNQPAAACQAALPAYDGLIRKRPKAIANEGTSNAFVTCAPGHQANAYSSVNSFMVLLANRTGVAINISCTLVDGIHDIPFSPSKTKVISVPANDRVNLQWTASGDNAGAAYTMPAVSCNLPPATEISGIALTALDEIGN